MMLRNTLLFSALAAINTKVFASASPTENCPNLGPAFVHDFDLKKTKAFQTAEAAFPDVLETLFSAGAISKNTTTFSIDVFSTTTNESVYSYHHIAPDNNATLPAGRVDDESIYRIGSVSKLYTAYAILAAAGIKVMDRPVTDYIPELLGGSSPNTIDWEEVTIGALMSQQGGTGGMPTDATTCFLQPTPDCSIQNLQDFLKVMRDQARPVTLPFANPLYSDAGWGVLGVVLGRLSGLPYNDALHELLGKPLDLNGTSSIVPPDQALNAVILPAGPSLPSGWGLDNPITAGSGGVYSNNADLRAIGLSILESSLLSPAATREWMKPRGNTGTLTAQVGAPWEINRLSLKIAPNSTRTRVSDLYTKLGGNPQYAGVFALSPDHGLGYSILLGGPAAVADRVPLRDALAEVFVTATEHAALENAEEKFTGSYVDEVAQGANITLTVDQDRPGLGLKEVYVNGTNLLPLLFGSPDLPPANVSVRLYPMGVEWRDPEASDTTVYSSYRAFAQMIPENRRADVEGGAGLFDHCENWQSVGFASQVGVATDEFVFGILDGVLESVSSPLTNNTFLKVK